MVACPQCGTAVQPDWEWCYECGYDPDGLRPRGFGPSTAGGPNANMRQGGFGGQTQFTPPQATIIPPSMGPPQRRHGLEILLVASVVLVLGVGTLIFFSTRQKSAPVSRPDTIDYDPSNAPTTTTFDSATKAPTAPAEPLPPELMTSPANPGVTVDEATARTVLTAAYPALEQARAAKQVAKVQGLSAGPAKDGAAAYCEKCAPPPASGIGQAAFSAPAETGYPANFLAQVVHPGSTGAQAVELIVFARTDAASPWLVTLDVTYEGAEPVLTPGTATFNATPPATGGDPAGFPKTLATEWQTWHDRNEPSFPTPFTASKSLLAVGNKIAGDRVSIEAKGIEDKTTFAANEAVDGVYRFAGAGNTDVLCSAVRWTTDLTPTQRMIKIEQTKDQSTFGPSLPAGKYNSVSAKGVRQFCMKLAADQTIDVLGADGGAYAFTAT